MKKIASLFLTVMILFVMFFAIESNAADLNNIAITTDKTIVNPGDTISLTITFGDPLGAYIFDILYDKNLFEFVSISQGAQNVLTDRVRVTWIDDTVGANPSNSLTVTFKAIEGNNQSVPTNFVITATGLSNPDATVLYDDITTPINIDFTVEPNYIPYTISLNYTDTILPNEEKPMIIGINSTMGRYYDNVRLVADVTGPDGSITRLLGTDNAGIEYDLIAEGLGGSGGYSIGGENFTQEFNYRGLFNIEGDYTLTFKLIDIGGNTTITQSSYSFKVGAVATTTEETKTTTETTTVTATETLPTVLPSTGNNTVIIICVFSVLTLAGYILYRKDK